VVAVEERQLLSTLGRVIGRIEIKRDALDPAPQPTSVTVADGVSQRTTIRTAVGPVESRHHLLAEQIIENDSLSCGIVSR
jgi:hypothetical protein